MSWLTQPDGSRLEIFGSGGGAQVSRALTRTLGAETPLLGQVPLDVGIREGGDTGVPTVIGNPDSEAAVALRAVAASLSHRARGLAGRPLGLSPV